MSHPFSIRRKDHSPLLVVGMCKVGAILLLDRGMAQQLNEFCTVHLSWRYSHPESVLRTPYRLMECQGCQGTHRVR